MYVRTPSGEPLILVPHETGLAWDKPEQLFLCAATLAYDTAAKLMLPHYKRSSTMSFSELDLMSHAAGS